MQTSNFANNRIHGLNGISISRYPDRRSGFTGPEFPPLMPPAWLVKGSKEGSISWSDYCDVYDRQLSCLHPRGVWDELHYIGSQVGALEPILLCYESSKSLDSQPCHRRVVAVWLNRELGVSVPEWCRQSSVLPA